MISFDTISLSRTTLNYLAMIAVGIVCLIGIGIRVQNYYYAAQDPTLSLDEQSYTQFALRIKKEGVAGLRALCSEYPRHSNPRIYPPPTRVAYLYALAATMALTGMDDKSAGILLSVFCSLLSLILLAWIVFRRCGSITAFFCMALAAVSPIDLALARRAWQDSMVGLISLAMLYLALKYLRSAQKKKWLIAFMICGACSLWIKESLVVIYFILFIWITQIMIINRAKSLLIIWAWILFIGSLLLSVHLLAVLCGGYETFYKIILTNRQLGDVPYIVENQKGPWYSFLQGFWILDPGAIILFSASVISVAYSLYRQLRTISAPNEQSRQIAQIAGIVIAFIIISSIPEYFKNMRYVTPVLSLFYITAGHSLNLFVKYAWNSFQDMPLRYSVILGIVFVAGIIAAHNYSLSQHLFFDKRIHDLAIGVINKAL